MKEIKIHISSLKEGSLGAWLYTYYCIFPSHNPTWRYTVKATKEGFEAMTSMWKEAGYTIVYENEYPR